MTQLLLHLIQRARMAQHVAVQKQFVLSLDAKAVQVKFLY